MYRVILIPSINCLLLRLVTAQWDRIENRLTCRVQTVHTDYLWRCKTRLLNFSARISGQLTEILWLWFASCAASKRRSDNSEEESSTCASIPKVNETIGNINKWRSETGMNEESNWLYVTPAVWSQHFHRQTKLRVNVDRMLYTVVREQCTKLSK